MYFRLLAQLFVLINIYQYSFGKKNLQKEKNQWGIFPGICFITPLSEVLLG